MARLLQVFGFLSVLFRGAKEDSAALQQACLPWIRRSALALAMMQISYVLANTMILRQSADMPLREVLGANFVLAGLLGVGAAFTVIALTAARRSSGYT